MTRVRSDARLQESLVETTRLLARHRVLETLTHRQAAPNQALLDSLQQRQNLAELQRHLRGLHAADLAYVLEALPPDDRRTVWDQLGHEQAGLVFVEVSETVRNSLVDASSLDDLIVRLSTLDPEDLAYVSGSVSADVLVEISRRLESSDRVAFEDSIGYQDDRVGRYMSREWIALPETSSIQQGLDELRMRRTLPPQTDRIFIIDSRHVLRGTIPLQTLLLEEPSAPVIAGLREDDVRFGPEDMVGDAVKAFERYDLVSAPVVDARGKLVGRLTVDSVMDYVREASSLRALKDAGLGGDEDLFAAPWASARNRWPWLGINLVTAFLASRVIGRFEGTIQHLAALATLMPIVASIGGNTGNQTMALVIRALAVDRIQPGGARRLVNKELAVSLMNGSVWGVVVGLVAVLIYWNLGLGLVMSGAVVLNLVVAGLSGVAIPLILHASGRDPAQGASVLLTFITDATGFFLFLGLASAFLL